MNKVNQFEAQCKMCGKTGVRFARSHIVPKSFFKRNPGRYNVQSLSEDGSGRKLQSGLYDNQILCNDCERSLGRFDEYASRIFIHREGASIVSVTDEIFIISFESVDRCLLRGFLATLLFRMSITKQKELADMSIGDVYEKRIAKDILTNGTFSYIDASIIRVEHPTAFLTTSPIKHRFKSVNGFLFHLPSYAILVSLDKRPHPYTCHCYHPFLPNCSGSTSLTENDSDMPYWIIGSHRILSSMRQLCLLAKNYSENRRIHLSRNRT